jgi:hypothetical protein
MSVIPVSRLSCSDLALLGNNFRPARGPGAAAAARRRQRRTVAAVNRSRAGHGEHVGRLHLPYAAAMCAGRSLSAQLCA